LTDTAFVCAAGPFVAESVNSVIVFILFPVGRWLRQEASSFPQIVRRVLRNPNPTGHHHRAKPAERPTGHGSGRRQIGRLRAARGELPKARMIRH
jgi:hypothetical protein